MIRKLLKLLTRWNDDSYLLFFFIFMCTSVFVIGPLQLEDKFRVFTQPVVSLMVISGVYATSKLRWVRWASILVAMLDFLVTLINYNVDTFWLEVLDISFTVIILMFLTGAVLVRVFRDGQINFYRILGSVSAYVLIGMVFGYLYYLCWLFQPGSFNFSIPISTNQDLVGDLSYFSFVTLFTVGYGDINAVMPMARSLATMEGLIGQLYPVVLIARLVSLELEANKER